MAGKTAKGKNFYNTFSRLTRKPVNLVVDNIDGSMLSYPPKILSARRKFKTTIFNTEEFYLVYWSNLFNSNTKIKVSLGLSELFAILRCL